MDRTDARLTALWLIWGTILILVLVGFTLAEPMFSAAGVRDAWAWLLPNLLPPMALVAGVSYQAGKKDPATATPIGKGIAPAAVTIGMSVLYLGLLTVSVLGCYFSAAPLDLMHTSNLWLGPLLAIATAILTTRFAR